MTIQMALRQIIMAAMAAMAAALLLAAAVTRADDAGTVGRISVSGQGSAQLAPDMALLTLTVTREAKTARAALDANAAAMEQVLKAMQGQGIAEKDLQTSNFGINPKYTQTPRSASGERLPRRIAGYTVRNSVSVRVRNIAQVGAIIDESVTLGVNEGGSIVFANDDPSAAIEEARIEAVKVALAKAATLATAAGVSTGEILELSEQRHNPRPVPMLRAEMAVASSAADSVPIARGENSYQVTVHIAIAIEQ